MTEVIAHRGAWQLGGEENSIDSMQKAIEIGCKWLEFDVRRTKDGVVIIYHDDASMYNYDEMDSHVPTLKQVVEFTKGKIKLDIEIKEVGYEKEILEIVKENLDYNDYVMKSFFDKAIINIKNLDKKITTGLLLGYPKEQCSALRRLSEIFPILRLKVAKANFISPYYGLTKFPLYVKLIKMFGYKFYVWTVNEKEDMEMLIKKKIDFIITDRPDLALEMIK